jgi:hypothetical protein
VPKPKDEGKWGAVAAELEKQPPTPWREIKRRHKVGDQFISEVKRSLGLPMEGKKRPAPVPSATPPEAPPTGGNGLDEFIPPDEPKAAPKPAAATPPAAPPKGASGGARSNAAPSAGDADERPIYECGACEAQWKLKAGEAPVSECPACEVSLS